MLEFIALALLVLMALFMLLIAIILSAIHKTLEKVLQRWAALDNLHLTPDARVALLQAEIEELEAELDPALREMVREGKLVALKKQVGFAPGPDWVLDRTQTWRHISEVERDPS